MSKYFLFTALIITLLAFYGCGSEPSPSTENATPVPEADGQFSGSLEELKANALDEGDIFGRVNHSLGVMQKEFQISRNLNPALGKVTVFVDEKFTILIRRELDGKVTDTKVNLKNLNPENGGMRLIPDQNADELPGFAVAVIDGLEGVEIIEDNKTVSKNERELKIYMASRENVQNVIPAFVQALHVVHGKN